MGKMKELYVDGVEASKEADAVFREYQNEQLRAFMTDKGTKHDAGKLDLTLMPKAAIESAVRALAYGANKYGRDNYKKGIDETRIKAALLRHLFADIDGEQVDSESGLQHLDHVAACVAMWAFMRGKK